MKVDKEEILQIIKEAVPESDLDGVEFDTSLTGAGLDSLDMANVLLGIQERYGVKFEDQEVDEFDSIDAIVSFLSG